MWQCSDDDCGALNNDDIYRCHRCDKIKPYFPRPVYADSPTSPDEQEGGSSPPPPTVSQPTAVSGDMVEMQRMSPYQDPWGGARPKAQVTRTGKSSRAEDRHPLVWEEPKGRSAASRPSEREQHRPGHTGEHHSGSGDSVLNFPDTECRIILIGRTGNGKSSAGNTILGMVKFVEGGGFSSETDRCHLYTATRFGIPVEVVDTPGFFDTNTPEEQLLKEIRSCIGMVSPGPHAVALVIQGGRFTSEQVDTVEQVRALFGPKVMNHILVIFTFGDILSKGQGEGRCEDVIGEKLEKAPQELRKLIKDDLNNRFVVFNNVGTPREKEPQVRALLLMVRDMLRRNENKPFSAPILEECENAVRDYEARVLALLNTSDPVTRQQIRGVFRRLMEKDEDTQEVLENVLQTQADVVQARRQLEETKGVMEIMIRQHKNRVDELLHELNSRSSCAIL